MALLFTSPSSLLRSQTPKLSPSSPAKPQFLNYSFPLTANFNKNLKLKLSSLIPLASSQPNPTPDPEDNPTDSSSSPQASITDEWGEKSDTASEPEPSKLAASDPPKDEDEWGEQYMSLGNGSPKPETKKEEDVVVDNVGNLKRCLVDTVYGSDLGFRSSAEVRAEVLELVNQLESLNPVPAPVESPQFLDGNWILLYTAFSELLPLLAVNSLPFVKVENISQSIDSSNLTIVNSTTLSSPFASFSFSASASFEPRSPSRIQVEFKESTIQPPEIKPRVTLPENVDVFGQTISLSPVQQSLGPLQDVVANISRIISGQPPLKLPIPGDRAQSSWLLITYLDSDLRISRGDGGLFILAKQGSSLLA